MEYIESQEINCPYCGEILEIQLEGMGANDSFVEDCHVCCRPIHFKTSIVLEQICLTALADSDI